ncbi:MAG TPA: orotate phosphoribosyltransferase [Rhizomicrobium sp.]|nr:orotate phosphoribosyltransferase [Rhizomicrobium sp.]
MATVVQLRDDDSVKRDRDALLEVIKARSFRRGHFVLSSGKESDLYFNLKSTMMDPQGSYLAAKACLPIALKLGAEFVGGLELGAVPMLGALAALSWQEGHPVKTFLVRKKAKAHGTKESIEGLSLGESFAGKKVLAVDDVASTGGSVITAVQAAREAGGIVTDALVLIDRQMGSDKALGNLGVTLHSIFKENDFR